MTLPTTKTRFARSAQDYIIMVFGPPGVGKTTFVNNFGNVLFLSTDRGTRFLEAQRVECLSWNKFEKVARELEAPKAPHYDFVCIDHVDDFANMAEDDLCKQLGVMSIGDVAGFGKGWKMYRQRVQGYIRRIMRLQTGVVFIAHEDTRKIKTRSIELDRTVPLMGKTAWKAIVPIADVVAYAGFRTIVNKANKKREEVRTVETDPREDLYAKDRTLRNRPKERYALLDGAAFVATFNETEEITDNGQGQEPSEEQGSPRRRAGRRARSA